MDTEPFIDFEDALLTLNRTPDDISAQEVLQIQYLINMSTSVILSYCSNDPRNDDPEQDYSALGLVAARLIMRWFPQLTSQSSGIDEQSFDTINIKFSQTNDIDPLSKLILDRFKTFSIV